MSSLPGCILANPMKSGGWQERMYIQIMIGNDNGAASEAACLYDLIPFLGVNVSITVLQM